jgi:hypothetical protein
MISRHHHHHNNNHLANPELGRLLARSGLTRLEISLMVSPAFFSLLVCCFFSIVTNLLRGSLFTCCNQYLLYSCVLSKTGAIFSPFAVSVFVLQSTQVYHAAVLVFFISAAVILLASHGAIFITV